MVANAKQQIVRINAAFSAMTGYAPDEVIGRTPRILASGRHGTAFYQDLWQTLGSTGAWQGEIWNRRKSGEIFPEWLLINALHDDTGELEGLRKLNSQDVGACWPSSTMSDQRAVQEDTHQGPHCALERFARADRWGKLVFSETTTGKVGRNIGHPDNRKNG